MSSSQPPPPPSPTTDYYPSSGISEVDSLSDSDWLDIASGKESDDVSLVSRDSDHDDSDFPPRSRRSSVSNISSAQVETDGEDAESNFFSGEITDAWAGVAETSPAPISPNLPAEVDASEQAVDATDGVAAQVVDHAEELRVKQALDQSMVGTLSASRTSTLSAPRNSTRSSLQDLRLSFPDPLTSSERLSMLHESSFMQAESPMEDLEFDDTAASDPSSAIEAEDLTTTTMPPAHDAISIKENMPLSSDLNIVLYGLPSIPQSFTDSFVAKAANGAGVTISYETCEGSTHWLRTEGKTEHPTSFPGVVAIVDSTGGRQLEHTAEHDSTTPSLAIVCLSTLPMATLPAHDMYLPIVATHAQSEDEHLYPIRDFSVDPRDDAERSWNMLGIPAQKTVFLLGQDQSPIVDEDELNDLDASHLACVLRDVVHPAPRRVHPGRALKEHVKHINLMTLMAVLSAVLACIVNVSMRSVMTSAPTRTEPAPAPSHNAMWQQLLRPQPKANQTPDMPASTPVTASTDVVPSSLKEFALSVFVPVADTGASSAGPSTHATVRQHSTPTPSSDALVEVDRSMTWTERVQSTKDLILRPLPASLSLDANSKGKGKAMSLFSNTSPRTAEKPTKAVGLRISTSLMALYDQHKDTIPRDTKELSDALDNLASAILKQTRAAKKIGDRLARRHMRAQDKARQLKRMGAEVIAIAGQDFHGCAKAARANARALRDRMRKGRKGGRRMRAGMAHRKRDGFAL